MKRISVVMVLGVMCLVVWADKQSVAMNFDGVEMEVFLQWFATRSNKRIIYSHLKGALGQKKVYLIAPQGVPAGSVEKVCMSLLETNGYTLVKVGEGESEVYKLVETAKASCQPIAILSARELEKMERGDYYISQLVLLKYLKADNVINAIRQAKLLDSTTGSIVEIKGANAIIISDFLPNVMRILKIVEMIDIAPPQVKTEFVPLRYARAEEVGRKLSELFSNRTREMAQYHTSEVVPSIISDSRTNSLTLRGTQQDIEELKGLIGHYDVEIKGSELVLKVYRLRHVTPDKIVPTLKEVIATSLLGQDRLSSAVRSSETRADISVMANDYTKAIIITAPVASHRILEEIIEELDVRRPQVLLEAVICEFTPSDVLNLGIELMKLDKIGDVEDHTLAHGVSSFGLSSIVDQVGNPISPTKPGIPSGRSLAPGSGITAFMTRDSASNIPFLIKALQSVTHTEVISVPRILTDDGEKAEIRVQNEVPVTSVNALNTSTTTTSFKEFVAAGTSLIITAHIVDKDYLRLEIEQNIEAFIGLPPAAGVPPPKSSRSLKTVVTVPSGQTVILGGLCGRQEVETVDKIPLLGDIPILGLLFQSSSRSVIKTNLYIFIRPQILYDPQFEDLKKVSAENRERVKRLQGVSVEDPHKKLEEDQ